MLGIPLTIIFPRTLLEPTHKIRRSLLPLTVWLHVILTNASQTFLIGAVFSLGDRMRLPLSVFSSDLILISHQVLSCNFNTKYYVWTWTNFIISLTTLRTEAVSFLENSVKFSATMTSHPRSVHSSYSIHSFYISLHTKKIKTYTPVCETTLYCHVQSLEGYKFLYI